VSADNEWLEIDGTNLCLPFCCMLADLAPLKAGTLMRGEDRRLPRRASATDTGVIVHPRRPDATPVKLRISVFGEYFFDGTAHPDTRTGLAINGAYLQHNVVKPPSLLDPRRTAVLHVQGLPELTKPVIVEGPLDLTSDGPNVERGGLRLLFPEGLFDLSAWLA
jgi:hypothetical protein